jgi:DNA-binding NarL/FixJ family response regulator
MRILLADSHPQALWALKTFLEEQPELKLVGEALDARELMRLADEHPADLILMDRELHGSHIRELIASLHALEPRPIVIVMSCETEYSRFVLKAGADACMSKGNEPDWLLEKLHEIANQINVQEDANRKNNS